MVKAIKISLFLLFLSNPAIADFYTKIIIVEGFGPTYREAIQNGLIEALNQTKGVTIDSKRSYTKAIEEKGISEDGQSSHQVSIDEQMQSSVREATQGTIHEYRMLDSQEIDKNQWNVKLEVKMKEYKTPGISPHSRRKIAIMPLRTLQPSYNLQGWQIASWDISRRLAQYLVTEMTQSRKFTVIDREYMDEFLQEKRLILSNDAQVNEQMKIGEVLGVDYLLIGTINTADIQKTAYSIQITGESGYRNNAILSADYRIIVMATRQIKWADSVSISLDDAAIRKLTSNSDAERILEALLYEGAKQIVRRALDNIYPIRVIDLQQNAELVLNQGGVTVCNGELFDVFTAGGNLVDPYTGESLGASEIWAATIQIVRVTPKVSYARVLEGGVSKVSQKFICRRKFNPDATHSQPSNGRKADVLVNPQGGVLLPFDRK